MKKIKENIGYILLFIFFIVILSLCPIMGDDWSNYIEGSMGLRHIIGYTIGMYFDWEGRIFSRLLIMFFTYHKLLWNIVNSIVIISIIYLINKTIKPKNKKLIYILSILSILLINIYTFSETFVWIAGNITYLFEIPLLIYYYYVILNKKEISKFNMFILIIINIIVPMFVENMGAVLVLSNLIILIYRFIKNKKIDKNILLFLIISSISFTSMLLSPGTHKRSLTENKEFNKLSILGKVIYNIPNFIYYTYIVYLYLSIIMFIANINILKNIKNKILKYSLMIFMSIEIIFSIMYLFKFNNYNNILIIIYFIIYFILEIILIYKYESKKTLFYYVIGMLGNLVMLVSPTTGFRTSVFTYMFLIITYLSIIDKYVKENKFINNILIVLIILSCIIYLILYISVYRQNKENVRIINENKNKDIIYVKRQPDFAGCDLNPEDDYHINKYKLYYGIDDNTKVKVINNNWKYKILYGVK